MKHVRESLNDFQNEQFFRQLFESEESEEKSEKSELQDKEKDALDIIKKINDDFEKSKSSAKGEISKYKEFWEEKLGVHFDEEQVVWEGYDEQNEVLNINKIKEYV